MSALTEKIEEIVLQHSARGMDRLRKHLKVGYCERAARLIVDNRGTVLIGTGFPVAGSFESDGPIGAIALYQVLTHLNYQPILLLLTFHAFNRPFDFPLVCFSFSCSRYPPHLLGIFP